MEIHHFFAGIFYKKQHKTTKSERKKAGGTYPTTRRKKGSRKHKCLTAKFLFFRRDSGIRRFASFFILLYGLRPPG